MERIKRFLVWCVKYGLTTVGFIAILIFVVTFVYYWIATPSDTILISVDDFPASLSLGFTPDALIDRMEAHVNDVVNTAALPGTIDSRAQVALIPQPALQAVIPQTALSAVPNPLFKYRWHGLDLNLARGWGMSLKARRFIEIEVIGLPDGGWRLVATLKDRPQYAPQSAGSAPRKGGRCSDLELCASELAEQTLEVVNYRRLLNYYIERNTDEANQRVLELYQTVPAPAIQPDELAAWGNAYFALHRYDDALQKYQDALAKDASYCPARIGRGLVYYYRPHGGDRASDLRRAENDFASPCGENDKFAQADLCSTLIREWRNGLQRDPKSPLLSQAQDHCVAALRLDSRFVRAAVSSGYILYRQGRFAEAIKYFDGISQQYPTDSGLFAIYGFLLYKEYQRLQLPSFLKRAINKTQQSWDLNKGYAAANNLGAFHYEQDEYPEAVDYWRNAILLDGNDADSRAGLALGLAKINDPNEAFESLLLATKLDLDYCRPELLRMEYDWSNQAASDLAALIAALPTELNGQLVQNPCKKKK